MQIAIESQSNFVVNINYVQKKPTTYPTACLDEKNLPVGRRNARNLAETKSYVFSRDSHEFATD